MQTKNGVYCCSLDICMTSDNYYSLDQDNRAAFAADQLLDRQANDEWLCSVGDVEAFEGISKTDESTTSRGPLEEIRGLPKES
jgi:hypothetical protein